VQETLSLGRRVAFGTIMAAVVWIGMEAVLQVYYYLNAGAFLFQRVSPPILEPDPTRCYGLKRDLVYEMRTSEFSHTIYTNAQGFRTDARRLPVSVEKPPDVYRVLFLGPSFAFGWGNEWEDTYAGRIAEGLRVPAKRVEPVNLGTPAQPQAPQLCWLRDEGYRFAPDLVVTTIYGNSIAPVPPSCPEQLDCPHVGDDGRLYSHRPRLRDRLISTVKNLATVFYGYYAVVALTPRSNDRDDDSGIGKELYPESERSGALALEATADSYVDYVKGVKAILGDQTEVAFIHVPLAFAVHPADAARWWHITKASPAEARADVEAGIRALRGRGLTVVHPTPDLVARAEQLRLYYWLDIHLTPEGNRIVADAAIPLLQEVVDRQQARAQAAASERLGRN
jgi:hypothetical protein